jgi:hypothetical protein
MRTFAAPCTEVCNAGLSGFMHVRLLLTQHFLAVAADFLLRCGLRRGSGHSKLPISVDFKPTPHCSFRFRTFVGFGAISIQTPIIQVFRSVFPIGSTQHSLARTRLNVSNP